MKENVQEPIKKEKMPLKNKLIILISLLIVALFRFIPAPVGLTTDGMQVIGTFIGVLILWVTIGIDWPSLLCLAALSFVPTLGINQVLKDSFGNATFAFLMFTFMCTYALSQTGFVRRCALFFVTSKIAKKGPWFFTILFFLSVLFIGSFMSPTVLFFIYLPILEEIYNVLGLKKGDKFASMLMIGLVTCTSLSSGMTPIAHVFPVLAIGVFESVTGTAINYGHYMAFAIPSGILIFTLMMLMFRFIMRPDMKTVANLKSGSLETLKKDVPKSNLREKLILSVFVFVILLWVLPAIIDPVLPEVATFINKFGSAMPPLLGVIMLAIIRIDNKPLLGINEAMMKGVSWPALIMSASTLALGAAMTNKAIGITDYISSSIAPITDNLTPILLILLFVTWAAIQSNLSSHMVTAQLVSTVAVPVFLATAGLNAAAIAATIGMTASIGSSTPPSMPYVAVAGASGWTSAIELIKYGLIIMIVTILTMTFVAYPIASLFMVY